MLEARGLHVSAGTRDLISDIGLAVLPGTITALAGPIGSGKSTLIRALAGLLPAREGTVTLDGLDLRTLSRREIARRVAVVFQENPPIEGFLVRDVVGMGRHPWIDAWKGPGPGDRGVVDRALESAGIAALAGRAHPTLSGGEKQLVQLARALAQQPRVLLLDEPAANLDLGAQWMLGQRLAALAAEGLAVLFSSHDLGMVKRWGDRIVLLKAGRVAAAGSSEEVLARHRLAEVFEVTEDAVSAIGL